MTDQEKNEVLLKFAGFRFHLSASENPHYWTYPDGEVVDRDSFRHLLPDLFHSLDAQAKWIIPKACYEYGDIVVYGLLSGLMLAGEFTGEACAGAILSLIGGRNEET